MIFDLEVEPESLVVELVVASPYFGGELGRAETIEVRLRRAIAAIFMLANIFAE